jgi:hypothetical protein
MPNKIKGESKDDFVKRCIPEVLKDRTAKDEKQAAAICFSMFGEKQNSNIKKFVYNEK